jgi:hypothetical protein
VVIEATLPEALARIGGGEVLLDDVVVPAECVPCADAPYRLEYAWMFHAERRVARTLDPWLVAHRGELVGPGGVLSEALANAYRHGHGRDPRLPIRILVTRGARGLLVRIEDRGPGFDVAGTLHRFRAGKPYFDVAGGGLRALAGTTRFGVFWSDGGRAVHLLHEFAATAAPAGRP